MISPKANERVAFYGFSLAGMCLILTLPLIASDITTRQFGFIRFAMALCFSGATLFLSSFFAVTLKPLHRLGLAIPLCALFWFVSPVRLFVRGSGQTDLAVVCFHIGRISDPLGNDITFRYEFPINEILKKHGSSSPESRQISFSDQDAALWNAREAFAELENLVDNGTYSYLRIGIADGPVHGGGNQISGPAVSRAWQLSKAPFLDEMALSTGIFLDQAFVDRLKEGRKQQYALIRLSGSNTQDPIYSMSLVQRSSEASGRRQVVQELSSYEDVFVVCATMDLAGSEREVSKDQTDRRLRWVAEGHLGPLLEAVNGFEGFFPGEANYLLFPTAAGALKASERILNSSRDAGSWDDHLRIKVFVSVHSGSIQSTGGRYFGPAIETARKLTREGLSGEGIALSSTAYERLSSQLKPGAVASRE